MNVFDGDGRFIDAILNSELALKLCAADRWTADQKKEVQTQSRNMLSHAYERRSDWTNARTHLAALLEQGGAADRDEFLERAGWIERRREFHTRLELANEDVRLAAAEEPELAIVEEDLEAFDRAFFGHLGFTLKPNGEKTDLTVAYDVGGYGKGKAPPIVTKG